MGQPFLCSIASNACHKCSNLLIFTGVWTLRVRDTTPGVSTAPITITSWALIICPAAQVLGASSHGSDAPLPPLPSPPASVNVSVSAGGINVTTNNTDGAGFRMGVVRCCQGQCFMSVVCVGVCGVVCRQKGGGRSASCQCESIRLLPVCITCRMPVAWQ